MSAARVHRWWRPYPGDPLPYPIMRLLWTRKAIGEVPWRSRPRWLWNALTYSYEICFDCGGKVGPHTDSYWLADDALWNEIMGGPSGVVCPPCFTKRCRSAGVHVYWKPVAA